MATTIRFLARTLVASRDEPITPLHWIAGALAATTGVVHLYLYWVQEFLPFLLAGLGFLGGAALLAAGVNRRLLYLVGVPFTGAQIAVWVVQGMPEFALGVADKAVQGLLVVALTYLFVVEFRSRRARGTETPSEYVDPAVEGR